MILGAGAGGPPPNCLDDQRVITSMATIRWMESRGDYQAQSPNSTASGAYQFVDGTWNNYAGYPRAVDAPAHVQDARARQDVNVVLARHNDIAFVPLFWYLPASITEPARMDVVPAGNTLTPREYQAVWLERYSIEAATSSTDETICDGLAGNYVVPPGGSAGLSACSISWGGYQAGRIPLSALRYHQSSNNMHPDASVAWEQLWNAANIEGFNLAGNGYRPATASSGAKCSNHFWGLAIDVNVLAGRGDAAFDSAEYRWLAANAHRFGFVNPDWARPANLGGTGAGGWAGGTCCHLEPWHWEYVVPLTV